MGADFDRSVTNPVNFEETTDKIIDIYLRFKDGFAEKWDQNPNNTMAFSKVKSLVTNAPIDCFFQNQQKDNKGKARQKILVPLGDDIAIEFRVWLYTDRNGDDFNPRFSYFVGKCRETLFVREPEKDTIKVKCKLYFGKIGEKGWGTNTKTFEDLYKKVDTLTVPVLDINKDKDREIWKKYVEALRKLVKGKEQIWKINHIDSPNIETYNGNERATYINIHISEDDIRNQFEEEIAVFFDSREIEDYAVSEDHAFIEFNSYRELAPNEKLQLSELAIKYFYELLDVPKYSIQGELAFKYSDNISKDEIFSKIKSLLDEEYQIDVDIDKDGKLKTELQNIPHIKKLVNNKYASILEVTEDRSIELKVDTPSSKEVYLDKAIYKQHLKENGFDRAQVYVLPDKRQIAIEVGAYLKNDFFKDYGLKHIKSIFRFGNGTNPTEEIEGTYIDGKFYCVDNIKGKVECQRILEKIQDTLEDLRFKQQSTKYIFELVNDEQDLENRRQFKTTVDEPDKCKFNIASQILTIWPDSKDEYNKRINQIREICPNIKIEEKEYAPAFFLKFKTDIVSMRQEIISTIKNKLRLNGIEKVRYDSINDYQRNLFEYSYTTEEEREIFKKTISTICNDYKNHLTLKYENISGTTTYTLSKNEQLESDKEKKIIKDTRAATFIYLTPDQKEKLDEKITQFGDDTIFKEGIQIGTLIKKDKEKLKFRISEDFDNRLNGSASDRIEISELSKGYIKPIFPGELTNIGRMIKAMKKVTEPCVKYSPANKNLPNFLFDPNTAHSSEDNLDDVKKRILMNLNEPLLRNQPRQLDAVAKAISARDMALIQGPPGTGKTTVIAEIIWQTLLVEPEAKILVTSQTNLAVDNALERLKGKKLVRPIRIGNIDKFEDEGKIYSDTRMREWMTSKPNSEEEQKNADNAIAQWLNNISARCSEDKQYTDLVTKWKDGLVSKDSLIKTKFANEYFQHVNVFAATCSECGSRNFGNVYQSFFLKNKEKQGDPEFDLVIMDEASKATPPELVLPLTLGKRVIIIGDHKQLPPMIDEKEFSESLAAVGAKDLINEWTKQDYKVSQFEKLFRNAPKNMVASLDTQFRMHEQIMNCITQFYKDQEELENGLICGIKDTMDIPDMSVKTSRWHGLELNPFIDPNKHAIWVNVDDKEVKVGTSYENIGEVNAIKTILKVLTKAKGFAEYNEAFTKEEDREVGIITYYMPQMLRIREALYPRFTKKGWRNFEYHKYDNDYHLPFRINTVDRFQGMERNIIIVSTVRSNIQENEKNKSIKNDKYPFALGFAREHPRINVGFSRAKRLLIVVGNEKHFANKLEYAEAIQKMHRVDISQLQNL